MHVASLFHFLMLFKHSSITVMNFTTQLLQLYTNFDFPFRPCIIDLLFIVIFYPKLQCGMHWLFDYFSRFVKNFLCYFFHKQASKDRLTQGNFLKTMLLDEKQSNLKKEMYRNISLYSQYFSPGPGSNVHKTYFYFLKLTKKYFILSS